MKKQLKYLKWICNGKAGRPPQLYKEKLIRRYSKLLPEDMRMLIETGTYEGETVIAVRECFNSIWTIELDKTLYSEAIRTFMFYPRIKPLQGNSAEVLKTLLKKDMVYTPSLFWLDAHYSGGKTAKSNNPLLDELKAIIQHSSKHIILIDDADDNKNLIGRIKKIAGKSYSYELKENIIRLVPK